MNSYHIPNIATCLANPLPPDNEKCTCGSNPITRIFIFIKNSSPFNQLNSFKQRIS